MFSTYQKMQASGLTEIILFICISAIWGHILFFLSAHHREQLQPNGCPAASIIFLPGCPGWLESLITVTSLLIDMAGNTPFLKEFLYLWHFVFIRTLWNGYCDLQPIDEEAEEVIIPRQKTDRTESLKSYSRYTVFL